MTGLFNKKILQQRIKNYTIENIEKKIKQIKNWQKSLQNIKGLNEKRLQSAFLNAIFEDILGYNNTPQKDNWTLDIEATTDIDAKHPDGIIGFFEREDNEEIRGHEAVIELKGPQVSLDKDQKRQGTTYKSPVDQAFSYTNKLDKCKWVIVSNFMEIRLYKVGRSKEYYEVFLLDELDEIENFKRFYYLLNKNNLLSKTGESITYKLSEKTLKKEEDISVKFYNLYKNVRVSLFEHLKDNNPDKKSELLLEKAQKFLDRIIFVGFCEDKGLLPNDLLHEAIQRGKESFSPSNTAVWDQIRGVFRSIDEGNAVHNINTYNGGLFEYDEDLDGLIIENKFFKVIYKISDYDFDSDVDVNILGHIFEQSISDIEKLKSDIKDNEYNKKESRRKKQGIYYTPQYITSYIVENAVGGYLEDIKERLGYYNLPNIEEAGSSSWQTRYTKNHIKFYNEYEEKLKNIKVLDPACGSGAFLNQAFDYLLQEHQWLNKQRDLLKGGQSSIFALETLQRTILKNNLYGVDLNEESVEITKLSLWLKTANKNKPLTNLDDNIKCGNSLIDDPEMAGDKAFKWEKEFKNIMNNGGFDIIVGNPPWVSLKGKFGQNIGEDSLEYLIKRYNSNTYMPNLYENFIQLSLSLLKKNGYHSFIVPDRFGYNSQFDYLRKKVLEKFELFMLTYKIDFPGITTDTMIYLIKNKKPDKRQIKVKLYNSEELLIDQEDYLNNEDNEFSYFKTQEIYELIKKVENLDKIEKLGNLVETTSGFGGRSNKITKEINSDEQIKIFKGQDIGKYLIKGYRYFEFKDKNITGRTRDEEKLSKKPKVLLRKTGSEIIAAYDNTGYYPEQSLYFLYDCSKKYDLKYNLGLLNSKFMNFYYKNRMVTNLDSIPQLKNTHLDKFPILNIENKEQKDIVQLVDKLIIKKEKLYKMNSEEFIELIKKYTSNSGVNIKTIIHEGNFYNKIYSGRARKIRNFTVNINTNIVTIYADKSGSGKNELLKFEENDNFRRQYIKLYLKNLTEEQLEKIDSYSGNILEKVLQIEIPDYDKDQVVKKVVKEWKDLQQEIEGLEDKIKKTDNEIDQMVYNLYGLTDEEIKIVEESLKNQ